MKLNRADNLHRRGVVQAVRELSTKRMYRGIHLFTNTYKNSYTVKVYTTGDNYEFNKKLSLIANEHGGKLKIIPSIYNSVRMSAIISFTRSDV